MSEIPLPENQKEQFQTLVLPYLKDCRSATNDEERNRCTLDELLKIIEKNFECPWRDLEGEFSRMVLRFIVSVDGNIEKFLTLFSDNSANRPSESINNALIRAVYNSNGQWIPVREGGRPMPREYVLPVKCSCNNPTQPEFSVLDTIPAYFADGHYQLQGFIDKNIVYPDGFLSKSGRQTTVLLKATITKDGKLDSTTIRVLNLNQVDYRLSENSINIVMQLAKRGWRPAMTKEGVPVDYTSYFKVSYVDDKNPRRGTIPTEWDITVGNNKFYNEGAVEFNSRNYANAVELFSRAVFLDPDDVESWLMLGQAYIGARNNSQARVALQRALDLGSKDAEKWMIEAEKPDDVEPILPAKEVTRRPERTERVRPVTPPGRQ
jgi:tetratricopeptide (TPR) repeat protein